MPQEIRRNPDGSSPIQDRRKVARLYPWLNSAAVAALVELSTAAFIARPCFPKLQAFNRTRQERLR